MRRLILIALLTVVTPYASAQRIGSAAPHFAPPRPASANHFGSGSGFAAFPGFGGRRAYAPILYWDPFYTDALYDSGYPVAAQPPIIFMQAPAVVPSSTSDTASRPQSEPLMIELQDGRYVRLSSAETLGSDSTAEMVEPASASPVRSERPQALPPVVLVFRDGHREEVSDYTIADGILYTSANYYTDGSWNRKIELSSLNLPESVTSNRARGVTFQLPNAPNEVVVRP